jgi:hypothetical protein
VHTNIFTQNFGTKFEMDEVEIITACCCDDVAALSAETTDSDA